MSLRLFLVLLPAFALGGYLLGLRFGPRAPAYDPRPKAEIEREDARLHSAEGEATALRRLAKEAAGSSLGARAERALIRSSDDATQRAAARRAFLERHPGSWLRKSWQSSEGR